MTLHARTLVGWAQFLCPRGKTVGTKTVPTLQNCALEMLAGGVLGAALLASAGAAAAADFTELSIEELMNIEIFSASKFPQKISETPASVSLVTAADIKSYGYRTLADILRSVRGMDVTYDRNYSFLGARGFNRPGGYNNRILLLVDGYRVNDVVYDSAPIGTEFILDVDLIERVEVVRGPGSSIYGSNAFFGVVNVITRHGRDYNGWEASGEAASFGAGNGRLTYGKQHENGAELLLSASYYDSRGQDMFFPEFNTPATNNGVAQGLDHDTAKRAYGKLSFNNFTLAAIYSEREKGIPTASFGTVFNDPHAQTTDALTALYLGYDGQLSGQQDITARMSYDGYSYRGIYPWDQPPVTLNDDRSWGEWWGADVKLVSRYDRHKLVLGAEYQDNFRQDQQTYDIAPYWLYLDDKRSSTREALYAQDEMTLRENLKLNAGLRYDHYSTVGDTVNPRLALIHTPRPGTALKLLYGTAFRAPNIYELYYASTDQKANQNLKPEEITSHELVIEHQLQPNFRLIASAYYNRIRNLIDQVIDPADGFLVFQNTGGAKAKGAEFEAERAWADDTRLRASYAWQLGQDQGSGVELANSPRHLAKLNYSVPVFDNALRTGAELQVTGSRKTLAGGSAGGHAGGHAVANLTLTSQKLAQGLELSASIYNLFGRRYADPARPEHMQDVILQDGRNFRFKLSYRF